MAAVVPFWEAVCSPPVLPLPKASLGLPDGPSGEEPSDDVLPAPSRVEPTRMSMAGLMLLVRLVTRGSLLVYSPDVGIWWSSRSCSTLSLGMKVIACVVM